jgi:large subunit ribosomal protein L12
MEYIYGALLLHKLGQQISESSLKKVVEATGKEVDDAKVKVLVASLQGVDISKELETATIAAAPSAGSSGAAPEAKKEEKKEEKAAEAAEGLSALFG